jgi:hypothetical protein
MPYLVLVAVIAGFTMRSMFRAFETRQLLQVMGSAGLRNALERPALVADDGYRPANISWQDLANEQHVSTVPAETMRQAERPAA